METNSFSPIPESETPPRDPTTGRRLFRRHGLVFGGNRKSFVEQFNAIERPDYKRAVEQYQAIAGAYEQLWQAIYPRTTTPKEWEKDGVGSCGIDVALSEEHLDGLIRMDLIDLRHARNWETPGEAVCACPNHRPGIGCILGDLKSPKCLDYWPSGLKKEVEERFGVHIFRTREPLTQVSKVGVESLNLFFPNATVNDEFTEMMVRGINAITDHIKEFPILTQK